MLELFQEVCLRIRTCIRTLIFRRYFKRLRGGTGCTYKIRAFFLSGFSILRYAEASPHAQISTRACSACHKADPTWHFDVKSEGRCDPNGELRLTGNRAGKYGARERKESLRNCRTTIRGCSDYRKGTERERNSKIRMA
jgi:hypothetical protein